MKFVLVVLLLSSYSLASTSTWNCSITEYPDGKLKKEIWSADLKLKTNDSGESMYIIDGSKGIALQEATKNLGKESVSERLAKYDGKLTVGLVEVDNMLKLGQGFISHKEKNMGPYEALAWADVNAKKIGVKNFQRNFQLECVKK